MQLVLLDPVAEADKATTPLFRNPDGSAFRVGDVRAVVMADGGGRAPGRQVRALATGSAGRPPLSPPT